MNTAIEKLSAADKKKGEALLKRVNDLLDKTRQTQEALHRNFTEVGVALLDVRDSRAWMLTPSHSWDAYIKSCEDRFGRGRTALYGYVSVAERLLPSVPKQTLIDMGISKAQSLAQYVKHKGNPPQTLIAQASDPQVGVEEFKAAVAQQTHQQPESSGKWFDMGGFYVTPEERAEILRAFEVAMTTDPPISQEMPEWARKKAAMQRFCQEFIATYEPQLEKA